MLTKHSDGVVIEVWLVPGASRTEAAGLHDDALRLRVASPPEGGKANQAAAKLLSTIFHSPVELISGTTARRKRFLIRGADLSDVEQVVTEALG